MIAFRAGGVRLLSIHTRRGQQVFDASTVAPALVADVKKSGAKRVQVRIDPKGMGMAVDIVAQKPEAENAATRAKKTKKGRR